MKLPPPRDTGRHILHVLAANRIIGGFPMFTSRAPLQRTARPRLSPGLAPPLSLAPSRFPRRPPFWPVYDRYQKEINAVGDRRFRLIEDYVASVNDLS